AMMRVLLACCAVLAVLVLGRSDAVAQAYPVKPVRIIVPLAAGGLADILARVVAQRLGELWGQSFVVENRAGAAGGLGAEAAARGIWWPSSSSCSPAWTWSTCPIAAQRRPFRT